MPVQPNITNPEDVAPRPSSMNDSLSDHVFPKSKPSVESYQVQTDIVLQDRRRRELVALNSSGRLIWELCDGTHSILEIAEQLSAEFEIERSAMISYVKNLLVELDTKLLVEFMTDRVMEECSEGVDVIRVAFGSCQVHVHTDVEEISTWLKRRFSMMLTDEPGRVVGRIGVSKLENDYHVSGCRRIDAPDPSLREVRRNIKYEIDRCLFESNPNLIWFHAGAVSSTNGAVLVGGEFGSGKSTVVSNLYDMGWTYLSDDIIALQPESSRVHAYPLTPMYRVNNGQHVPNEQVSELERFWVDLDPGRVGDEPSKLCGIVFPRYDPSIAARLEPLSGGEALVELVHHCLNFTFHKGEALRVLSSIMSQMRIFRLVYGEGAAAARLVDAEFGSSGPVHISV